MKSCAERFGGAAAALAALLLAGAGCSGRAAERTPRITINGHTFAVEIADTPGLQRLGLSGRPSLAADRAMLFVFGQSRGRSFYMRDCYFPIDIALDADRRILNLATMAVEADPSRPVNYYDSAGPARYVVEAAGGTWERIGAEAGMKVEFFHVPGADPA
ncbi:MAG: DUF192 domain-containing protein [Planctomycetes bacterium]|nr:DUF192 domain-containing protein [Planctomycetota bacterium]